MIQLICEHGVEAATIARIVDLAGVSRQTFYLLFEGRSDCLHAVLEEVVAVGAARAGAAYRAHARWVDGVRAALLELLELSDEEPQLAQLCIVQALATRPATLARREEVLATLIAAVDRGRAAAPAGQTVSPLTAEGVVGGVLAIVYARLLRRDEQALVELLNPLMAMIALPYLGHAAARTELSRRPCQRPRATLEQRPDAALGQLQAPKTRLTYRTMRVLAVIAEEAALSNSEIARRAGISDQGQISKLLARLSQLGLIENRQSGGGANAWWMTPAGNGVRHAFARRAQAVGSWWRGEE
jgi:AcrR family transcriptional regulator